MPNNVIRQAKDAVTGAPRHLGEAFCLGLVLEGVAGEIYAGAVDICLDDDVDAADAVKRHFDVFIGAPVAEEGHVLTVRGILLVA